MRTTVRLDEGLLEQVRREAARRGETLTSLVELGLRLVLAQCGRNPAASKAAIPLSSVGGGLRPGIDLNNNSALLDLLEERS
jgi:hypothetical protein